jgi:hypothetical protein
VAIAQIVFVDSLCREITGKISNDSAIATITTANSQKVNDIFIN